MRQGRDDEEKNVRREGTILRLGGVNIPGELPIRKQNHNLVAATYFKKSPQFPILKQETQNYC